MQERTFYVGIDWGNDRHAICVTDEQGEILKERFVRNDATALKAIAELTAGVSPVNVRIGIETSRLALVEALVAHGYSVFSINPRQLERFRERATMSGAKDDQRDARAAASALRTDANCFRPVKLDTGEHRRMRIALRGIEAADASFRREANHLRDNILIAMPALLDLCPGADEPWFWALAERVLKANVELADDDVSAILRKHRIRRRTTAAVQAVLRRPHLYTSPDVRASAAWAVEMSVKQLRLFKAERASFETELAATLKTFPKAAGAELSDADLIRSVPGYADWCTASLLVEASAAIAARSYQSLRGLAGVAPVTRGTGKQQKAGKSLVSMRRACNSRLRLASHHAANSARLRDPRCKRVYVESMKKGHSHARALRSVADRLLSYMIGVLRSGKPYDAQFGMTPPSSPPSPSTSPPQA